jgi:hypothetical protein
MKKLISKSWSLGLLLGTMLSASQAQALSKSVGIWVSTSSGYQRTQQNVDAIDTVFLDWWQVAPNGGLLVHDAPVWTPDPAIAAYFRSHCVQTYGAVATDDTSMIAQVTGASRSAFINNLVNAAVQSGVDGIHLDIEDGASTYRAGFSQLVIQLSSALHAAGKKLSIFTPAFTSNTQMATGINDWSVLEQYADRIELGAYDLNFDAGANVPGPIQGKDVPASAGTMSVNQVLTYVSTVRHRADKYYLGIAWYAYLWVNSGSGWALQPGTKSYAQVASAIAAHGGAPVWDAQAQEFSYQYSVGSTRYLYWYGERQSSAAMSDLAVAYGLPGVFAFQSTRQEDEGSGTQGVWDISRAKFGTNTCGVNPQPTATRTATATATKTATKTATVIATSTATKTATGTATKTATPVPTSVVTATPSRTAAPTPQPTAIPTTAVPTAMPTTAVPTSIPTAVPTTVPTSVPTATFTPSTQATQVATPVSLPDGTPTKVATPGPSLYSLTVYDEAGGAPKLFAIPAGFSPTGFSLSQTTLQPGSTLQITLHSASGDAVLSWNGSNNSGLALPAGLYQIMLEYNDPKGGRVIDTHTVTILAASSLGLQILSLAPNPLRGQDLQICLSIPGDQSGSWRLYAMDGSLVAHGTALPGCNMVRLPWMAQGVYILQVQAAGQVVSKKLGIYQ